MNYRYTHNFLSKNVMTITMQKIYIYITKFESANYLQTSNHKNFQNFMHTKPAYSIAHARLPASHRRWGRKLPSVFQADNNTDSSNKMEVVTVNRGVAAFPNDTYQDCCDKAKLITACNTDN